MSPTSRPALIMVIGFLPRAVTRTLLGVVPRKASTRTCLLLTVLSSARRERRNNELQAIEQEATAGRGRTRRGSDARVTVRLRMGDASLVRDTYNEPTCVGGKRLCAAWSPEHRCPPARASSDSYLIYFTRSAEMDGFHPVDRQRYRTSIIALLGLDDLIYRILCHYPRPDRPAGGCAQDAVAGVGVRGHVQGQSAKQGFWCWRSIQMNGRFGLSEQLSSIECLRSHAHTHNTHILTL